MGKEKNKNTESVRIDRDSYQKIKELSDNTGIPKRCLIGLAINLLVQECGDAIETFKDPNKLKTLNDLLQEKQKKE